MHVAGLCGAEDQIVNLETEENPQTTGRGILSAGCLRLNKFYQN